MQKPADTQYPIIETLKNRWSPYAFDSRPVEPDKLRSLFEAARWAASSFNEQPWRFILATRDRSEAFAAAIDCLAEANQGWARHAPALIFGLTKQTFSYNNKPNRVHEHDLAAATTSLAIQATALGLAVHQMAGIVPARIIQTFGVPEGFTPLTAAAIGYAGDGAGLPDDIARRDQAPRARKPFDQFVFEDAWEQPSPLFA